MGYRKISLKAIADECNVSINTVSHALRDMDDISVETKSRIRQKAFELGYMPNQVAQNMKSDEQKTIAIVTSSFANLYYNSLNDELVKLFLAKNEFNFILLFSDPSKEQLDIALIKQCILQRVDLVLSHVPPTVEALELAKLNCIHITIIGSNSDISDVDTITIDNKLGCQLAAKYLSNFHSGAKFLYVGINYFLSDIRYDLYRDEVKRLCGDEVKLFNFDEEDVSELFHYIDDGYRNVSFYCDAVAYEALYKLDKLVVDVRKLYPHLHIVGFDCLCEVVTGLRQISSICIDFHKYAKAVYNAIIARLAHPEGKKIRTILPVALHQRTKKE